ncbi:MBL fold metallo-hydrolase [Microdochium nivale]|nr:MBL fold metallo-hydrolase [Microdochium nivale]
MAVSEQHTTASASAAAAHTFKADNLEAWRTAVATRTPLLVHLNGDTTWLLQLPVPTTTTNTTTTATSPTRSHFNILLDPWLQGPQSDVASWFSTQYHVVAPTVQTIAELQAVLAQLDDGPASSSSSPSPPSHIDAIVVSHEFTDHCHEDTLRELPRSTPVIATDKAAALIRSWGYFDTVVTTPGYSFSSPGSSSNSSSSSNDNSDQVSHHHHDSDQKDWHAVLSVQPLPPWLGIGRVVTPGNSLYYHSAVIIVLDRAAAEDVSGSNRSTTTTTTIADAVIYSPHGIKGPDLAGLASSHATHGINTLALLHGLHDVRIWMTKQLNLGARNGREAARACRARYWVATHDEVKSGAGFIAPLLRRVQHTVADAVARKDEDEDSDGYEFVELGSGDGLVLAR